MRAGWKDKLGVALRISSQLQQSLFLHIAIFAAGYDAGSFPSGHVSKAWIKASRARLINVRGGGAGNRAGIETARNVWP